MSSARSQVTRMLLELTSGDTNAADRLFPLVYSELRRIASGYMKRERASHTLQATEIVHEAYVRLVNQEALSIQGRTHFFAVAARAMRNYLVDYARRRDASKRGGGQLRVTLNESLIGAGDAPDDVIALDAALSELAELDVRQARIVELRYFTGLTIEETAEILNVSPITVKRDWRMARAWLKLRISGEPS